MKRLVFPFSAIVGLDKLKLAILINAINPKIGGVLIKGAKGSGKSTIVRSLADILPSIEVIRDCPFNCSPDDPSNMCPKCSQEYKDTKKPAVEKKEMVIVDLPLGATEDRVVGSLDVEKAIKLGVEALKPGILAAANQNILYVDEVNLLPDHIADDLLDAAATGWNTVEREGVSVSHPSRFIFVGTMNPEEGELRPQLLDRFALSVTVGSMNSVEDRAEIVRRNMEFEDDPEASYRKYEAQQEELRNRIIQARITLKSVVLPKDLIESISKSCVELKVDGLRPDIVIAKSASTLAAFEERNEVSLNDVLLAAELSLGHRTREGGFMEPATPEEVANIFAANVKKVFQFEKTGETTKKAEDKRKLLKGKAIFWARKDAKKEEEQNAQKETRGTRLRKKWIRFQFLFNRFFRSVIFGFGKRLNRSPKDAPATEGYQVGSNKLKGETYDDKVQTKKGKGIPTISDAVKSTEVSKGYPIMRSFEKQVTSPSKFYLKMGRMTTRTRSAHAGKHAQAITALHRGKPYGWKIPHGKPTDIHMPATIRAAAMKQVYRERPFETALKISLGDVREKLRSYKAPVTMVFVIDLSGSMLLNLKPVKEALLKLHGEAYRNRDRVGIVALKGLSAVVVQHPITNLRVVANRLLGLHVSGYTPLATGMIKAWEVLKEAKRRDPSTVPVMVMITDGNVNVPLKRSLETGEIREIDEVHAIGRDYEGMAERDVISASKLVKREGIHTIVINTNPHVYGRETYGFWVTEQIAYLTGGGHHAIGKLTTEAELVENMIGRIREEERAITSERSTG
jgi:Mg-chelatase subunit ChlI/Mg-chelatase subunit ChlD